jgi:small subunit ribosomal protein S3Ae
MESEEVVLAGFAFLGERQVAEIPATEDEALMNRVIMFPLKDITRDMSHMYTTVKLRVYEIKGRNAFTKYIGHEISREYLSTLVRRRRDALEVVFNVKSKDEVEFRVKALVITQDPCSEKQKHALRKALTDEITGIVSRMEFGDFIQALLSNKISAELSGKLRKIVPLRRVEIRKTQLKEFFDTEETIELPIEKSEKARKAAKEEKEAAAAEKKEETEEAPAEEEKQ